MTRPRIVLRWPQIPDCCAQKQLSPRNPEGVTTPPAPPATRPQATPRIPRKPATTAEPSASTRAAATHPTHERSHPNSARSRAQPATQPDTPPPPRGVQRWRPAYVHEPPTPPRDGQRTRTLRGRFASASLSQPHGPSYRSATAEWCSASQVGREAILEALLLEPRSVRRVVVQHEDA